ncbi:riboflavin synthase subunit alpha [Sodalis sp. CWE]|uniref:riboflavin synthase subunit alpha n=1 Tax=Sodalis sp. CWE TaxID=2803816 RepID=UPI001C7DB172|nr:riboflavin synthase subunit alpha [Sodalis sp. CWE]MBX4181152.1 riboflavin synthase subunit alpha [Sodalis sp. CWE]
MFTGIVQAIAPIVFIDKKNHYQTHFVKFPRSLLSNLIVGASVAHNGCCLTVTKISDNIICFDLIQETINLTNLGELSIGDEVNIERAVSLQTEVGGHLMSGHITCTAKINKILHLETCCQMLFSITDQALMKYILYKGYIGVDGISLTVGSVFSNSFLVHVIPETLSRTTLGKRKINDKVNIEIDAQTKAIVDTTERILTSHTFT